MLNHDLRNMFLTTGLPADQIDYVLDYFQTFGGAAKITSPSDYETAMAIYGVMDRRLDPADLHTTAARYLISLGSRIAAWENQAV